MTRDQIRMELRQIDLACSALRATGGYKYRQYIRLSDEELQRLADATPTAMRWLMLKAMAGTELAKRLGKEVDLDAVTKELMELAYSRPPQAVEDGGADHGR